MRVAGIVALATAFAAILSAQSPRPRFGTELNLVVVDTQVTFGGNIAKGLTKEDFAIFEDGKPQPIVYCGADEVPVDVLVLLDVSGSMRPEAQAVADRAQQALAYLRQGDRAALMV